MAKNPFDVPIEDEMEEEEEVQEEHMDENTGEANLVIHSPRHLWDLGAFEMRFRVETFDEVAQKISLANDLFANLEETMEGRIIEVAEYTNRATLPQKDKIMELCGTLDKDVPDNLDFLTKGEASKLIDGMIQEQQSNNGRGRSRRSSRGRSSRSRGRRTSSGRSSRRSSRGSSSRSGRYRSTSGRDGGVTSGQRRFINQLCDEQDIEPPSDLDGWSKSEASDYIQDLLGE